MPAVLALPLSLVTTAVFAGTVLLFAFCGILAFVSTTPSRWAALLLFVVTVLFVLSAAAQPVRAAAAAITIASACLRRIY
jgi:hypothetical protein